MISKRGLITVISGPSGTGKGTLISGLMAIDSDMHYAVSATTREKRYGETEGISYHFKTSEEFEELIGNGEVLEWDEFCGNKYGTLRSELETKIEKGLDVILDLTVKGAMAIKAAFPEDSVTVFLLPPSIEELNRRITLRGDNTPEDAENRINIALNEIKDSQFYDYIIVNNDIEIVAKEILKIIA